MAPAGLIPAPRLQEWRVATSRLNKMEKNQREQGEVSSQILNFITFIIFVLLLLILIVSLKLSPVWLPKKLSLCNA